MTNPIDEYLMAKTSARSQRAQNELHLWQKWKDSGEHPDHLQPLLEIYEPNLNYKASTRGWRAPNVPQAAFKLELQDHLIKAFQTYDPNRGAALNTHVETRLQKAKRYNVKNQNMAYIPEGQVKEISKIQQAHDHLSQELGRPPTHEEIADYTGLRPKQVETIQRARRKDIPGSMFESDPLETQRRASYEEQQIHVVANTLPQMFPNKPEMHTLFNHIFGMNDHEKITSTGQLAKKMNKNQSQIARMKTQLGSTLQKQFGLKPPIED
jgi:DNA-directed RNA polymerase specialized sigma subunit